MMSGLLPSFMNGAAQGYGLMENIYDRRSQRERQAGLDEQNKEVHDEQMKGITRANDNAAMSQGITAIQSGFEPDDEAYKVMEKYNLISDEGRAAAEQNLSTVEGIMQSGNLSQFRSSKGLDALNSLLAPDINSDPKGAPLPGRRQITDILPGQDKGTAVFELAGEYEDGTPFKGQPMTEGRGRADDGDNVIKQQFIGNIVNKLKSQRDILNEYKNNPEFKAKLDAYARARGFTAAMGKKPDGDWKFNDKTGLFWNAKTGETREELPAGVAGRVGGDGSEKMPDYVNFYDKKARTTFGNLEGFLPDEAAQGKYQYFAARASQLHKQAAERGQQADPNEVALEVFREMAQKKILSPSEANAAATKDLTKKGVIFDTPPTPEEARALAGKKASDSLALPGGSSSASAAPSRQQPEAAVLKPKYSHPSGKSVTREEINATAKNRGITPEEVIKTLGLK